ncbi:MAG TPA: acetyl-CoA carboxylase carboxyltransferase subunit alpha [Terriglobales bacterium]|nr:acetyl-CoA carboxylase carboxyltransferase subunit alpha [Terriglobales bacterium]
MDAATKAKKDIESIETQIASLESDARADLETKQQLYELHRQIEALRAQIDLAAAAWKTTEIARHPQRPYFLDYVERIFSSWSEIHGDRRFSDDPALLCGMARFHDQEVLLIGTQKGRDAKQRVHRNFGMANPEGYRKALRAMKLAEKFHRSIISFIDIPGAYPGLGAEERGQGEAIALNLREMSRLRVPTIAIVTGEGGSGGALAIAVADRVLMLQNSIYSVISPEGCASIMWRDATKKESAAQAMKITAKDLLGMKCIDSIVPEPHGGAHNDFDAAAALVDEALQRHLRELRALGPEQLIAARYEKFRHIAQFFQEN